MVAAIVGDYSLPMTDVTAFRVVERQGPFSRLVLRHRADEATRLIVISGYRGNALPERITQPELTQGGDDHWRLNCAEGVFEFQARGIDRLTLRPGLYEPMHARFKLSGADRIAIRVLLRMLRFPGGMRVLRWWESLR